MENKGKISESYQKKIDQSIEKTLERIKKEMQTKEMFAFSQYPSEKMRQEITQAAKKALGDFHFDAADIDIQYPPAHVKADFMIQTFSLGKKNSANPNIIAQKLANEIADAQYVESANAAGPFVNIDIAKKKIYSEVLNQISKLKERYGESDVNSKKVAVFDYSAPNIAKPIGVGHLRSTIIGQALVNIYEKTGFSVVKDNHLGDWGTQFGKLLYAYINWADKEKVKQNPIRELKDLYVRFNTESEEKPELKDEARKLFAALENGDEELVKLWKEFYDLSVGDFNRIYEKLGVSFDTYIGESYFTSESQNVVDDCMEKNVCKKEPKSGALIVEDLNGLPTFLVQKSDGSTLYITRDLATMKFRINTFKPDALVYVVGQEQELHFKQLFATAKAIGYLPENTEVKHIGFGMVLVGGKKMSTRQGTLIELDELLAQSIEKSKEILHEKNPDLSGDELEEISQIVGIGAIIYNDLRQSRVKNISFDWDRMLDLEGGSAPYLQYTYVRINSILRKVEQAFAGETNLQNFSRENISFEKESEFAISKKLMLLPSVILKAQQTDSPHDICVYLEELALLFNSFYNEVSIIKTEDENLRKSRILLSASVANTIKNGLALLSIKVPEKM